MNPADVLLIEQIRRATRGAARLLVTLARRGKAIERDNPQRAAFLLAAVATHPLYKGGRLTFDMLEIEDLMLGGSSVELTTTREVIDVLNSGGYHLVEMLRQLGFPTQAGPTDGEAPAPDRDMVAVTAHAQIPNAPAAVALPPRVSLGPGDDVAGAPNSYAARDEERDRNDNAPELRSSDYLYDYVVLGLLDVLSETKMFQP